MQIRIFSIHDSKAEAFMNPFYSPTAGTAIRMFTASINTPDHEFHKYSADYTLFELGSWNEDTGKFTLHKAPRTLGNAIQYRTNDWSGTGPGNNTAPADLAEATAETIKGIREALKVPDPPKF